MCLDGHGKEKLSITESLVDQRHPVCGRGCERRHFRFVVAVAVAVLMVYYHVKLLDPTFWNKDCSPLGILYK